MNKNIISNENKGEKSNLIDSNQKFSSYFGDSNNNVYFEIKQFGEKDKKLENNNQKRKEASTMVMSKRGRSTNFGNFNSFGVQSEALYIPNEG